ncbi:MAG: Uma2 family endonuclease [Prochlorotrichaceae cyanobacterium]|jgi:Uma2 family endonuclease
MLLAPLTAEEERLYPSCDGKPMAENTEQYQWIVLIAENLQAIFDAREDVFIAADLLWYPIPASDRVAGEPYVQAPDVMVVFDRPKGFRMSYIQHKEAQIAPQVVFEILSASNKTEEGLKDLQKKFEFYQRHGVEEYYIYDPLDKLFTAYQRQGDRLVAIKTIASWVSPRLGIRFEKRSGEVLKIYDRYGDEFFRLGHFKQQAESERLRAEQERLQKEFERQAKQAALREALRERQEKEEAQRQVEALKARLKALGLDLE